MDDDNKKTEAPGEGPKSEPPKCSCKKITEENLDYKDAYLRAIADYDNLRKETLRLRNEYAKYAASEVITQILPVLDNLKKALAQAPAVCEDWVAGVRLIREQLEKILSAAGVTAIEATAVMFNPLLHEALMREKREGVATDMVVQIIEPGYKMHDRVLRAAKVIVAE